MKTNALRAVPRHSRSKWRATSAVVPSRRYARHDPRWMQVVATLDDLHIRGRHAVRIVDADCGAGTILIEALAYARSLGFTAVEGLGIDGSPALIARAITTAGRFDDPGIGLKFQLRDAIAALCEEAEFPADIVLWHGAGSGDYGTQMADALARAGKVVIGDPEPGSAA